MSTHYADNIAATRYIVEASDTEQLFLWVENRDRAMSGKTAVAWESDSLGYSETIGHVKKLPVVLHLRWAKLDGVLVMFYEPVSRMVDWELIEKWLKQHCWPQHGTMPARCNAMNFAHCICAVKGMAGKMAA